MPKRSSPGRRQMVPVRARRQTGGAKAAAGLAGGKHLALRGRQYARRRSCCHRLHISGVNLHCYGLRHHVYGKNEIIKVLLPNQNPFDAFEWAPRDANPLTTFQEKMWFYAEVTFYYPSDRLNLFLRDASHTFAVEQNRVDSRSCKDLQSASGSSLNKDIAREKGE